MSDFHFTFKNIEQQYKKVLEHGYTVITLEEYYHLKIKGLPAKVFVNRVDVDFSVKKTERLADIFNRLNIKATFFIRLHAPEYNPFSFENYRIIKKLLEAGHEVGYHSEVIDQAAIWNENAEDCLRRDINILNLGFNIQIKGVASHGGNTGLNNLDFWKNRKPEQFHLLYEAYDKEPGFNLFHESFFISDSEWTRWKCYNKGTRIDNDRRSLEEHLSSGHSLLYVLIHPDTYFDNHIYE